MSARDAVVRAVETTLGTRVERAALIAGGASREAWSVELEGGDRLLVRRAMGGRIHSTTLSLEHEFAVLGAAREAGVTVPEPVAYLGDVDGREAFAMAFVEGETIGRRIVRDPPAALDVRLAEELARIHAIPRERLPFLPEGDPVERLRVELDAVGEPHPAVELGLAWCAPLLGSSRRSPVVLHGDFRVGNLAIDRGELAAVLDWEFCHVGDPLEDLSWPLVRAWRFGADGLRLGGIAEPNAYLARYAELTGVETTAEELHAWEVFGNCSWATGALRQTRRHLGGEERSVELAILGRLACETELEILDLVARATGHTPQVVAPHAVVHDRPSAGELADAVRGFLEGEILPTLDDRRLRFRTLVAMNALGIVARESAAPADRDPGTARAIREHGPRAADLDALYADVRARLAVASPATLERT